MTIETIVELNDDRGSRCSNSTVSVLEHFEIMTYRTQIEFSVSKYWFGASHIVTLLNSVQIPVLRQPLHNEVCMNCVSEVCMNCVSCAKYKKKVDANLWVQISIGLGAGPRYFVRVFETVIYYLTAKRVFKFKFNC